jgi:tetratricopeptide (TPR) repeat protein
VKFRLFVSRILLASFVLTLIAMLAPATLRAQCEPLAGTAQVQTQNKSSAEVTPEFFDEPSFTVAGVTDPTNFGGHVSGMVPPRTTEALARDVVPLGKESPVTPEHLRSDSETFTTEAGFEQARAFAQAGDYDRARTKARDLLAEKEKSGAKPTEQAELHHLLGDMEEKLNNPLDAVREYQRAAELDPSESNLFDLGAELLLHRATEPSIRVFGKGNRLFPNSVRMLVGLGVAGYSRGSYNQAAHALCEATDLNPSDPTAYPFLGKTLLAESANSQGITDRFARYVRFQPESALANYYYAVALWKQRKSPSDREYLPQIESLLKKAVRLDPKLGAAYLQLGVLYAEDEDTRAAISAYENAVAATPQLPEAHYRLSQAYRQAGDLTKAQQELEAFKRVSKESAAEDERQRREVQEFVYTRPNPNLPPP